MGVGFRAVSNRATPAGASLPEWSKFFDGENFVARLCAARQIRRPAALRAPGALPRAARNLAS